MLRDLVGRMVLGKGGRGGGRVDAQLMHETKGYFYNANILKRGDQTNAINKKIKKMKKKKL